MAREINKGLVSGLGWMPSLRSRGGISVVEAITETIRNSKADDRCRRDYKSAADCFLRWLTDAFPGLELWRDLRPSHINQYVTFCENQGLAYDSVRKRLFILKAASRFMSDEFEYRDIARKARIKKPDKNFEEPEKITLDDVQTLITHAEAMDIDKAAMLSLMAFCGLREWEAAFLRECDIDLQGLTIKIDATDRHKPKSRDSRRLIPVPKQIGEILTRILSKNKIRGEKVYIFQSGRRATCLRRENQGQGWSPSGVSATLRQAVRLAYRDTRSENLKDLIPRHLRSFFVTLMTAAGASDVYVRRYIGHAPLNVMERHYLKIDTETLRREICGRIEVILDGEIGKIKSPALAENLHFQKCTH